MKVIVNPHYIKIIMEEIVNEGEFAIQNISFDFSEEYIEDLVKVALFTKNNKTYKRIIENNICEFPPEINKLTGDCLLGVYAYKVEGKKLILRYSPIPKIFPIDLGSYKEDAENSEEITPSEMEQYMQILHDSLKEVGTRLKEVEETSKKVEDIGVEAEKQGTYAKEQGDYAKKTTDDIKTDVSEGKFDGKSIEFIWQGTKLGVRIQGASEYIFVDLQGKQGPIGPQGEAFRIKKTYSSKELMDTDFDNMTIGDYVMIASNVNEEDNAKLYTKTETDNNWVFIADFSGAVGIQGPIGKTPHLTIGSVTTLEPNQEASVSITGTDEDPILNLGIPKGENGDKPVVGVDYFTESDKQDMVDEITESANSVFNQNVDEKIQEFDNHVTEKINEFDTNVDSLKEDIDDLYNNQIVGTVIGNNIHLEDSADAKLKSVEIEGNLCQKTTVGYQSIDDSSLRNTLVNFEGVKLLISTNNFNIKPGINFIKWIFEDGTNVPGTSTLDNVRFYAGNTIIKQFGGNTNFTQEEIDQFERVEIRTTLSFATNYNGKTIKALLFTNDENMFNKQLDNVEEYTGGIASPNTKYPQDIEVIDDNVEVGVINENLFDNSTVESNKSLDISTGTEIESTSSNAITNDYLRINENETYSMRTLNGVDVRYITIYFYDIYKNYLGYYETLGYVGRTNFTAPEKTYYCKLAGSLEKLSNFQITVRDKQNEYIPHQQNSCLINLKGNYLAKTNYAVDKLKIINNHAYIEKNIEKERLVFTSKWNKLPETDTYYEYATKSTKVGKKTQNTIKASTHFGKDNDNKLVLAGNNNQTIYIRIPKKAEIDVSTLELWKNFLDENEIYFYYELADTETIDLGIIEMPKTFRNISNISLNVNLESNMKIEYIKDLDIYLKNITGDLGDIEVIKDIGNALDSINGEVV